MKILFVNDYMVYAGAEKLSTQLAQKIKEAGHKVKYVAPFLNRDHKPSGMNVLKTIMDWQPDLIHLHNICTLDYETLEYPAKHDIPVAWTVHDWYPVCKHRTRINVHRKNCNAFDWRNCYHCQGQVSPILQNLPRLRDISQDWQVATLCNAQRLTMHDFGYESNHTTVIKNGVDTSAYTPEEEQGYIFCHGVMRWEKAPDWHLKSAATLPYKHLMSGVNLGYTLTPDIKTHFLGFLPETALIAVLQNASLVQTPSRWHEPCGLTILESFSCGKPVIAVALGGVPEYVEDEKTGFLVEPDDYIGFVDCTRYLMENDDLRAQMSKNCLEASRYYSLDRMTEEYLDLYVQAYGGELVA